MDKLVQLMKEHVFNLGVSPEASQLTGYFVCGFCVILAASEYY